jgi:hypothetical protein
MASTQLIQQPISHIKGLISAHEPIKFTLRLSDSTAIDNFPSCLFIITPRDSRTNEYDYDNKVTIRVQPSINVPNILSTEGGNKSTINDFALDLSSICRDYLSYDLRSCTQDTSKGVNRDITQSMPSYNMFKEFSVTIRPEELVSGVLTPDSNIEKVYNFKVANVAFSHEEQHSLYIANRLYQDGDDFDSNEGLLKAFTHSADNTTGRQKYLTLKPNHRIIGTDECEYISIVAKGGETNYPYALINFTFKSGLGLTDGRGNTLALKLNFSAQGNGSYSSSGGIYHWGGNPIDNDFASHKPELGVFQLGVGTRNIKEAFFGWTDRTEDGTPPIGDWSNIASYTVKTLGSNDSKQVGQTLTYHINHDSENDKYFGKSVRFHWQNRLGGIDSYTFDGMATEGIKVSSKMYEQSIYPQFTGQIGNSVDSAKLFANSETPNTSLKYGGLNNRIGGLTSDEYRSVSKSTVKAFREGQAVSNPYPKQQQPMMEDLLSSPNVWVERGWKGREIFRDNFDAIPTSGSWNVRVGDFTTSGSVSSADGHTTGTNAYIKGDNGGNDELWVDSKKLFYYDPEKIYEVEVRVKRTGSGLGTTYCGLLGYAENKTTKISTAGANTHDSAHYITLKNYDQTSNDEWEVWRGYISGHISAGDTAGSLSNSPNFPAKAYTDIEYFAPQFIFHFDDKAGTSFIDYLVVREYESDLPMTSGWYSTLNKNYYVPVNIKDASTSTFDSENQSTMTINYVESKEKRTIQ